MSVFAVRAIDFLACVGLHKRPFCTAPAAVLLRPQKLALENIWQVMLHSRSVTPLPMTLSSILEDLNSRRIGYSGESISVARDLEVDRVLPAWPTREQSCILPIEEFISEELKDDLLDPPRCLLPRTQWPNITPRSKVRASDSEWYSLCKAGGERNILGPVAEEDLFRGADGELCLNGAMGIDKPKCVDGVWVTLLRFI